MFFCCHCMKIHSFRYTTHVIAHNYTRFPEAHYLILIVLFVEDQAEGMDLPTACCAHRSNETRGEHWTGVVQNAES